MSDTSLSFAGQRAFDPLGPTVLSTTTPEGRGLHYIDEGDPSWTTLVFFGGAGTTVRAFGLLEFARTFRQELKVRVISVERNGLGQTEFDPAYGPTEYAADVHWLLDKLEVETCSLISISGGGPYSAEVAAMRPERIRSFHIACAFSSQLTDHPRLPVTEESVRALTTDPVSWWRYTGDSPVHRIPGFADSTYEEAVREFFVRGQMGDPAPLLHAMELRNRSLPDLSAVTAPVYLYWGTEDAAVPIAYMEHWASLLSNVRARRVYEGEGHDVQYRHWDQIIADVATLDDKILISDADGTRLIDGSAVPAALENGGWLGLQPWKP
ncbi:pimeloyl-ACP methyl ester carboxylesterase [Antricoccus suffuscus]|uniref:Pimeloyl-ACP methyl ester carboxylesterase n=1 Tax=Antricoccus suffuscus TaxID=1629062 RepID=A0A2T0ZZC8_9ACTN|nr:alpha/beta hydrolase [Antricoccus suffuscus]PRZ41690.1 pimeloyl-ACP methyl ester carboxylesterase [Antricoccus suffuscus]